MEKVFPTILNYNKGDKKMLNKIQIVKNPNGDTRTAPKDVSFEDFARANDMHINDVKSVMRELAARLYESSAKHDYTKKTHEHIFYRDFLATMNDGADFVNGEWYQLHVHEERHHPLSFCHKDFNLLDLIEMCVDCTVSGIARSGSVRPMEVSTEIMQLALDNTSKLVQSMCNVVETQDNKAK